MTYGTFQAGAPPADPSRAVGLRLAAWFIDLVLYVVVFVATFLPLADRAEDPPSTFGSSFCDRLGDTNALNECFNLNGTALYTTGGRTLTHFALLLAWFVGVHVLLQGLTGGSLGKLATGVRVVTADGRRPGVGRALVRSLLWVVDGLPCCMPLVGLITLLSTGRKQRVGDLAARTFVVRAADQNQPVVPAGGPGAPAPGAGGYPGYPPAPGYRPPPGYPPAPQGYPPAPGYPPRPQGYPPNPGYPPPPHGEPPAPGAPPWSGYAPPQASPPG